MFIVALHVFFALSGQRCCILARSLGVSRAALPESGRALLLNISTRDDVRACTTEQYIRLVVVIVKKIIKQ